MVMIIISPNYSDNTTINNNTNNNSDTIGPACLPVLSFVATEPSGGWSSQEHGMLQHDGAPIGSTSG